MAFSAIRIILSGDFGFEISPEFVRGELMAANGRDIEVILASRGGSVFDGIDIYNQFSDYKRHFPQSQGLLKMSGVVASMAAYLALNPSFDLVIAEDNAAFMIHEPTTVAFGTARSMRAAATMLDGLAAPMIELVSEKMGIGKSEAEKLLADETWLFGQEIVDSGLADEIIDRPIGSKDRTKETAAAELKETKLRLSKRVISGHSIRPAATADKSKLINFNNKEGNSMTDQAKADIAVKAEKDRIKALMDLKQKYAETPSGGVVSGIVDAAIVGGDGIEAVNRDIVLASANGNTLAAMESPGGTPQGQANTASGEAPKFDPAKEENKGF